MLAALLIGDPPFPPGDFIDMTAVVDGDDDLPTLDTRAIGAGTKAVHEAEANATRATERALERNIV